MAAPKREIIEAGNTFHGRQSWNYREIYKQGPHKLRVSIKVDSYDFQSYAKIEVWHTEGWTTIQTIPYAKMRSTKMISYTASECSVSTFDADRNILIDDATKILF